MPNKFKAAVAKSAPVAVKPFPLRGVYINSDKPVTLQVRHAGFSNPGLASITLKVTDERRANDMIPNAYDRLVANSRYDARLYAKDVVTGWENCKKPDGTDEEATFDNVLELLLELVDGNLDLFIEFKNWVNTDSNFVAVPVGDPTNLGK